MISNMLRIMFGARIDSAQDPLVAKAMEIGLEFMELTGKLMSTVLRGTMVLIPFYIRGILKFG